MTPQIWIGLQICLDLLMVALLVWFLRTFSRLHASWGRHEAAVSKAEAILAEMRDISRSLEANLKEKKELSHRILTEMDQELKRAEASCSRISALVPKTAPGFSGQPDASEGVRTRASVRGLIGRGLPKEEIARTLGISLGEVELVVKLFPEDGSLKQEG